MNPLALRHRMLPPGDLEVFAGAPARAFLIGMRDAGSAGAFQPMRVIMVVPGRAAPAAGPAARAFAARERIAIDSAPAGHGHDALRAITGQVLRDAQGRLFERREDNVLAALGGVLAGPNGELYEWRDGNGVQDVTLRAPTRSAPGACPSHQGATAGDLVRSDTPPRHAPARQRRLRARERSDHGQSSQKGDRDDRRSDRDGRAERSERSGGSSRGGRTQHVERREPAEPIERAPAPAERESAAPPAVRALLPSPGKWVQVPVGEFAALLHGQFARPQRLADDYKVGAWLQVFVSEAEIDAARAAHRIFGSSREAARLAPWSAALAERLGVPIDGALGGGKAAGSRFCSLTVVSDPTAQGAEPPGAATNALRSSVPPRFLAALPARVPREQAQVQMQHAAPPAWWRRWRQRVSGAARAAWQQQLCARPLDEQLWLVPPPAHGLQDRRVRAWASRTLRLAGYDAARMGDEWELYWRCRGTLD
jgi:hypothetical protein